MKVTRMRMHNRYQECERQKNDVRLVFFNALHETDLTYVETVALLTDILASVTKGALRAERHPDDPHLPADAER